MTLSTLKTMNVQMTDLRDSMTIRRPDATLAEPEPEAEAPKPAAKAARKAPGGKPANANTAPPVDPMQWWGALTKQFTELAATAMKDSATDAAKTLAGAAVKQGVEVAGQTIKKAAGMPAAVARKTAGTARKRKPAA
jgi:hypothetical protein